MFPAPRRLPEIGLELSFEGRRRCRVEHFHLSDAQDNSGQPPSMDINTLRRTADDRNTVPLIYQTLVSVNTASHREVNDGTRSIVPQETVSSSLPSGGPTDLLGPIYL